jgi:uncharacterized protein YhaN
VRDERAVAPSAVEEIRSYRNKLWEMIQTKFVARSEISAEDAQAHAKALDNLPASLTEAIGQADNVDDRRFDNAEAAGEIAVLARNIADQETRIAQLEKTEAALGSEWDELRQVWQTLWADVPIDALEPDEMAAWLDMREGIVALVERLRETQYQLDDSSREQQEALDQIHAAMVKVGQGAEDTKSGPLRVVIERAESYRREQVAKAERITEMREAVRAAALDVAKRQRELETAEESWTSWESNWAKAIAAVDLKGDSTPDTVAAQLNVLDEMRDHAAKARDLRDKRIATIERYIEAFEQAVATLVSELAPDLHNSDSDSCALELNRRRENALKLQQQQRELAQAATKGQRRIEELMEDQKVNWASVEPLLKAAQVDNVADLSQSIARSDEYRSQRASLSKVLAELEQQGDGLSIEALEQECHDVDVDSVRAKQEAAEANLRTLGAQLEEAVGAHTMARKAFQTIDGNDAAVRAAADCEEALATMQGASERYVRLKSAGLLLRWAVERYRKEKQGPLLKRAGELFRVLTRNSFARLEVGFDEQDNMHLTGVRPNGAVVAVPGLSTGTEDQLFLALRIAAVEDYLARTSALPFVADDLFINFDTARSAAGFEVLGQLSEKTQVLFFTHHQHLVDLARQTLGGDVHVVMLADAA